jgi:Tfp pilus assembly protein PilN
MKAVNLLPDSRRAGHRSPERSQERTATLALVGGGLLVLLVSVVIAVTGLHQRGIANEKQVTLAGLADELTAARAASAAAAGAQSQTIARFAAVSAAASGRIAWDSLLDDLSRVMPPGTWLSDLSAQAPLAPTTPVGAPSSTTPTPEAVPTAFRLTGFARSQNLVPRVLERLALIPTLSGVALQQSQRVDVGDKKAIQFTIGANVRTEGGK